MHHLVGKEENYFLELLIEGGFHEGVEHCAILTPPEERFLQALWTFC